MTNFTEKEIQDKAKDYFTPDGIWIAHEIDCKECHGVFIPSKHKYAYVPDMCDDCFDKGVIDMTTPEGYEKGMEEIRNDPILGGKILIESPIKFHD